MMSRIKKITLGAAVMAALPSAAVPSAALALESYPPSLQSEFFGWCAGQSYSAQVCKCAASQAAVQVPAVAMTSFLAAAEGNASAAMTTSVGVSVVQIATTCAATSSSSSETGDAMKSLGGLLGN